MTPLELISERVNRNGDLNDPTTPRPLLTLEEYFIGNTVAGSICCNCTPTPEPQEVYDILQRISSRSEVVDVRVQIFVFDIEWPFSDTVWIVTSADAKNVKSWFPKYMAPDECLLGQWEDVDTEDLDVPDGYTPIACWWD